jgi:hypothetical protein
MSVVPKILPNLPFTVSEESYLTGTPTVQYKIGSCAQRMNQRDGDRMGPKGSWLPGVQNREVASAHDNIQLPCEERSSTSAVSEPSEHCGDKMWIHDL